MRIKFLAAMVSAVAPQTPRRLSPPQSRPSFWERDLVTHASSCSNCPDPIDRASSLARSKAHYFSAAAFIIFTLAESILLPAKSGIPSSSIFYFLVIWVLQLGQLI
jgi:hypothetical protein